MGVPDRFVSRFLFPNVFFPNHFERVAHRPICRDIPIIHCHQIRGMSLRFALIVHPSRSFFYFICEEYKQICGKHKRIRDEPKRFRDECKQICDGYKRICRLDKQISHLYKQFCHFYKQLCRIYNCFNKQLSH
jgi:hypothetical protein